MGGVHHGHVLCGHRGVHPSAAGVPTGPGTEREKREKGGTSLVWKFKYLGVTYLQWPLTPFQVWLMGKHLPISLRPYRAEVYLVFPFPLSCYITTRLVQWHQSESGVIWIQIVGRCVVEGGMLGVEDLRGVEVKITRNKEKVIERLGYWLVLQTLK